MNYPFKFAGTPAEGPWPQPARLEYSAYMRGGAATAGDVLMQDYHDTDTATSTAGATNANTHIMANVLAPTAAGVGSVAGPYFGVALRGAADDTLVNLCLFGYCSAFVIASTGSPAIGDALVATTAKNLDLVTATGERVIAQAQEAMTTPTTRTLGEVLLNGVGTFCTGIA